MSDDLAGFRTAFELVTNEAFQFCFAVRAREFKVEAKAKVQRLGNDAQALKSRAITEGKEAEANELLCYQELLYAVCEELKMWIHLADDEPDLAWHGVVAAETHYRVALKAHDVATLLRASKNMERIVLLQQWLFPPQIFLSAGSKGGLSICSICNSEYGTCDHLVGLPYMGELCYVIVEDAHLTEVSIVVEPALKTARVLEYAFDGVTRNLMTWRPVNEALSSTEEKS